MKEITFNKDQIIFRQGDNATVMYDIVRGKVGVFTDYQAETETKLAELDNGQIFGELGMLEYYPRSATAVALEDGTVLAEIGEEELSEYFKDKPEKLLLIMKQISHRLRETTAKYMEVCKTVSEHEKADPGNTKRIEELEQQMQDYAMRYSSTFLP